MSANAPPGRGGAPPSAPLPKLNHLPQSNSRSAISQPCGLVMSPSSSVWQGWVREALRLFCLWWHSGDQKHFQAFSRHCDGMRAEIRSLRIVQAPFGAVFWALEQRIARIADEIERRHLS